jgi:hypothetical protein
MKTYFNDVNELNQFDDVNNFEKNSNKHVVIRTFKTIRRREKRIEQKIRRKIKKLKIVKFMHIEIIIANQNIIVLINSNNEINLISQKYVEQIDVQSNMNEIITLFIINERKINIHDIHFLNLKIDNCRNRTRYFDNFFLTLNIIYEYVMLNMF